MLAVGGRVVRVTALTVLGLLLAAGLAPFALREEVAAGSAVDAAPALPGAAQAASEGLRGLGYTCSDAFPAPQTITRVYRRVRDVASAEVRMLVAPRTGVVRQVSTTIDEAGTARASHAEVLEVVTEALGLDPADRTAVLDAVATDADGVRALDWGSFFLRAGAAPESQLRSAPGSAPPPDPSTTALAGSLDALAAAARDRGYTCSTPEVRSIRSCSREADGYTFRLWMDGTATAVSDLDLEVLATYRAQTRRRWLEEMGVVAGWLGTEQGRSLGSWLELNADAPGADSYVDGLSVSFFVRTGTYTKETFGGIRAR